MSAALRPLRDVPEGESERVVLAGDHGLVKATLGDGERGELIADHGVLKPILGDVEDRAY